MITISSHILDSTRGISAVGIRTELYQLISDGDRQLLFDVEADEEGRISESVEINASDSDDEFELVFHAADFFSPDVDADAAVVSCVVIRFRLKQGKQRYHMPVLLAPNSYSTWYSS